MSNLTEYSINQAVWCDGKMWLIYHLDTLGRVYIKNLKPYSVVCSSKLITKSEVLKLNEHEIITEMEKLGWTFKGKHLTGKHISLYKNRLQWVFSQRTNLPKTENLKEYCEEGLIANQIIKALNLVQC